MIKSKPVARILPVFLFIIALSTYAFVPTQMEMNAFSCETCPTQNSCAPAQYLGWTGCIPDGGEWCELWGALCPGSEEPEYFVRN